MHAPEPAYPIAKAIYGSVTIQLYQHPPTSLLSTTNLSLQAAFSTIHNLFLQRSEVRLTREEIEYRVCADGRCIPGLKCKYLVCCQAKIRAYHQFLNYSQAFLQLQASRDLVNCLVMNRLITILLPNSSIRGSKKQKKLGHSHFLFHWFVFSQSKNISSYLTSSVTPLLSEAISLRFLIPS